MKVDVRKAFDNMDNWSFILATVEQSGMNGILSGFLKASFHPTTLSMILNGRPVQSFNLICSVDKNVLYRPLSLSLLLTTLA